jgi:small subunit ribosomal protein S6e
MAELKLVIGNKKGKSFQKVHSSDTLIGRRVGETLKGDLIGVPSYEFLITGGSDNAGFPMRKDIKSSRRVKILARKGVGISTKNKGQFIRKSVAGNTIDEKTSQVNLKVEKEGTKKLEDLFGGEKEAPKEEKKEEKPKEEKKEEPKEKKEEPYVPKGADANENKS